MRSVIHWTAIVVLASLLSGCVPMPFPNGSGGRGNAPVPGTAPPEISAQDWLNVDGPQSLAELKGNVVLVEFWATWCGPCVQGIPHMNEMHEKYGGEGLRIVSLTDEDRETIESFQKRARTPIDYPIGVGSPSSDTYGVEGIPQAFVVGRDGKIAWEGHPADAECEQAIRKALATPK
ncbi:MAG: TlpA family protein disulfide reductase [Planctomycetales bacterium]